MACADVLHSGKKLTLGTQAITLSVFSHGGASHVFVTSDRPAVVYTVLRYTRVYLFLNIFITILYIYIYIYIYI